jgi:hypothetical protein
MPQTVIRGTQVLDGSIQRPDLDVTTVGSAVVAKIVQGAGITLSSTGADSGTGDVTISRSVAFVTKSAAYTLTTADSGKYVICSGGSWTLTLPTPVAGLNYQLRNDMGISGTIGTITLSPTGGTIDGLASIPLLPQQECTIITDGTNWRTFGLKREVILGTQDITSSTASGSVLLPVGYRYFELQFTGFNPVTNDDTLSCQFSTNGGSTWITTGYYYGILYNLNATTAGFSDAENTTYLPLIGNSYGGVATPASQSKAVIWPGSATQWPTLEVSMGSRRSVAYQVKWEVYGLLGAAGVINALKYFAAGTINNSFLTVKGVV